MVSNARDVMPCKVLLLLVSSVVLIEHCRTRIYISESHRAGGEGVMRARLWSTILFFEQVEGDMYLYKNLLPLLPFPLVIANCVIVSVFSISLLG